jgi:FADH2 O2-dependent halogenase
VHHVFPGGWIWVLRFNNGLTSAGVACTQAVSEELRLSEGASGWARLLEQLPSVRECFAEAEATLPFVFSAPMAYRRREIVGERWALLPSAAGFIDPLLSTGFPLTLLGIERLARLLETKKPTDDCRAELAVYAQTTRDDLAITAKAVGALYACMDDFPVFTVVTKLYFAAVMFSETKRRLGHTAEVSSFLLREHPTFAPKCAACLDAVTRGDWRNGQREALLVQIRETVEPFDLAGLNDVARQNCHPCLAEDLLAGADKLNTTQAELQELLARAGFSG